MTRFQSFARGAAITGVAILAAGCPQEAIEFSKESLDFGTDTNPAFFMVWNNNPGAGRVDLVLSHDDWIVPNVRRVVCPAPPTENGPFAKQNIQVEIDRSCLPAGTHMGEIVFSGSGVVSRSIPVTVRQTASGSCSDMSVENVAAVYSAPYLVDFSFTLRDRRGNAIIRDPRDFTVVARENGRTLPGETGVQMVRGAVRQLRAALVLDYTDSMQRSPGAIGAMERAATGVFLPALNEDALVSVTEFHREDRDAIEVVPFTVDRGYLNSAIAGIQGEYVQGFAGASRLFDTLLTAIRSFSTQNAGRESRYLIVFTDGGDTSSFSTANDVINAAQQRGVRIFAVDFGEEEVDAGLIQLTSNTRGQLFAAASVAQLEDAFRRIVRELDGQYNIRWATLARSSEPFRPGFMLTLGSDTARYTAETDYVPTRYVGDGVLRGKLRFITSDSLTATTVFLRADYVPRNIRRFKITLGSAYGFGVEVVDESNFGLLAGWDLAAPVSGPGNQLTLDFTAPGDPGEPMPYGAFGPMLRITFDALLPDDAEVFNVVYVDNTVYPEAAGQSFDVAGYNNTPPE
ncbi:MAG: VWA domain-containing protein [Candidatus Hydrogenedentes bacterium]|nr:VWA domain-containing protein [Candidatus Hydrogenedentota bacterium]